MSEMQSDSDVVLQFIVTITITQSDVSVENGEVTEDVDSPPKDFEVEAARAVSKVEGVKLDHTPENTGKTAGIYKGKQVRPDITGTYNGKPFVMDTKLYKRKYVDKKDVKKIVRDSKALGDAYPLLVHSGPNISEEMKDKLGKHYIHTEYGHKGWEKSLQEQFKLAFRG